MLIDDFILQNATETFNNETRPSHNINDNPDFGLYQMVYALTIAVILGTSLLRGLVFTKVSERFFHDCALVTVIHLIIWENYIIYIQTEYFFKIEAYHISCF